MQLEIAAQVGINTQSLRVGITLGNLSIRESRITPESLPAAKGKRKPSAKPHAFDSPSGTLVFAQCGRAVQRRRICPLHSLHQSCQLGLGDVVVPHFLNYGVLTPGFDGALRFVLAIDPDRTE